MMTVDELIDLTQVLLDEAGFHLGALRDQGQGAMLAGLTDEQFLLAVRFVAGERPVQFGGPLHPIREDGDIVGRRRERTPVSDDEWARRLAELEELDEETPPPAGPVDLGDGVTLL